MENVSVLDSQEFVDGLVAAKERVCERDERRWRRAARAAEVSDRALTERVNAIRARIAADLQAPESQRTSAFRPLTEDELGFLERQMFAYERDDRLVVLESRASPRALMDGWLAILRVNHVVGRAAVSCDQFRIAGRSCMQHQLVALEHCVKRWDHRDGSPPLAQRSVAVLPWRAGLLYGEVLLRSDRASLYWHIGARRNERTLAAEIYHESVPPPETRDYIHLVCDPMLATGGTQAATINRLIAEGVAPERIIACAIVAAPEGVDLLLSLYPHLRIVTCALDECLDEHGYITGPGLGDFGDLAYGDLDEEYVTERWVTPGLLTRAQAALILERTVRARVHHGETRVEA